MTVCSPTEVLYEDEEPQFWRPDNSAPVFNLKPDFDRDMRREGWDLVLDHESEGLEFTVEPMKFIDEFSPPIGNEEMMKRANKLRIKTSQRHAEAMRRHEEKIPGEFREFIFVLLTIWQPPGCGLCVPLFYYGGAGWNLDFNRHWPFFNGQYRFLRVAYQ